MEKPEKNLLSKPNATLVMLPKLGKLTGMGRKIYNAVLKTTKQQALAIKNKGGVIDAESFFSFPLKDLVESVLHKEDVSGAMTDVKKYLSEMRRTEFDWKSPDAKTGVIWHSMSLFSEIKIELRNGVTWVHWALPPTLVTAVIELELFTILDLDQIAKLNSYSAIALYEICSRYKENPTQRTSRNPTDWWTDALTGSPPSVDPKTGVVTRREWRKFKSEFVLKAINNINANTDITISIVDLGKGTKDAQFTVQQKKAQESSIDAPKINGEIAKTAARLDIPLESIAKMVCDGAGEMDLTVALYQLDSRVNADGLDPVTNKTAYLKKLMGKGKAGRTKYEIVEDKTTTAATPKLDLLDSPEAQRRIQLKEEFLQLVPNTQQQWAEKAADVLRDASQLSPSFARKFQDGTWKSGILLSKTIDVYASATHGNDWLTK